MANRKETKVQKNIYKTQNTTQKNKDRATRTLLTFGGELRCYGRVGSSCFTGVARRVTLVRNPVYVAQISIKFKSQISIKCE